MGANLDVMLAQIFDRVAALTALRGRECREGMKPCRHAVRL